MIIPSLANFQGEGIFLPTDVCESMKEAREKAAAYALARIKLPTKLRRFPLLHRQYHKILDLSSPWNFKFEFHV